MVVAVEPAVKKQAGLWSKVLPRLPGLQEAAGVPLGNEWLALAPPRQLGHADTTLLCGCEHSYISTLKRSRDQASSGSALPAHLPFLFSVSEN